MKITGVFRCLAVALSCALTTMPQLVQAGMPAALASPANVIYDVALQPGGRLEGQVLDSQGRAMAMPVAVVDGSGQEVARVMSDEHGHFTIAGLGGGVYQLTAGDTTVVYRLWAPNTAPPAANAQATLVNSSNLIRANNGGFFRFLHSPWFWGGAVATAIAVPLALDDAS